MTYSSDAKDNGHVVDVCNGELGSAQYDAERAAQKELAAQDAAEDAELLAQLEIMKEFFDRTNPHPWMEAAYKE